MPRRAPRLAPAPTAVQSSKRQKNGPARSSIEDRLPQDALEAILGFLDQNTLCTARLVSKTVCAAASANIRSLTCRSTSKGISRQRFPRLGHVTVHHSSEEEGLAQMATGLTDLITTSKVSWCQALKRKIPAQITLMPKLRELELYMNVENMEGIASLLPQCTTLEIIRLGLHCSLSVATTILSMPSLKGLSIGRVCQPGKWAGDPADPPLEISWLQQATALCNLQDLCICTTSEALSLIANLTSLTGLTWFNHGAQRSPYSIEPLVRLTKLRSLCLMDDLAENNVEIACSLGSGSLVKLNLSAVDHEVTDSCGRFLTRQTALERLTLQWNLCSLRHLGALRIDLLQSLKLEGLSFVDAEGLSALRKATSLTRLHIRLNPLVPLEEEEGDDEEPQEEEGADEEPQQEEGADEEPQEEEGALGPTEHWLHTLRLSQGIGGLTRLRSLSLHIYLGYLHRVHFLDYALAVGPMTGLTQLEIHGGGLNDGDLRALLGLTGLRVLDLSRCCLTDAVVPDLSVLTNLKKLSLISAGVNCEAALTKVLNPLRNARGWPPLECEVGEWK